MDQDITFGSIVKERRQHLGLTQVELARRASCAAITVRKIEANDMRPSVQISGHLADALHIPEDERLAFVRLARAEPEPTPIPTPKPVPNEIGQEDLTGRAIKGFELGERIAVGGFGAVYRALQPLVEREVAVKIILPQYADHPEFIRRFEAEAQLVARLEHPYIVPLYDYWREPTVAYLVMRLMRGGSLQARLKDGSLPPETAIRMMQQIGDALRSAHRAGIIHRDIKPANILLDEDSNAYLADFGFAKNLESAHLAKHTQAGTIVGSLAYISPEQIQAGPVNPRSDIYCLGIVFYEMLTGQKAFKGTTPIDFIQQHLNAPVPPLNAQLPDRAEEQDQFIALDPVIARSTAKNPAERYPNIKAMLADIQQALHLPPATSLNGCRPAGTESQPPTMPAQQTDPKNPFKGLRAFTEADTANFFGRDALLQDLLGRLSESDELARFLAVVGPSGSGKSSVVKAGLIPILRQGGLPGSDKWFIVEMVPGRHPLKEMEAALLRVAVNPPDSLLTQLRQDKRGLLRAVPRILPADDNDSELMLVIDQFEEVFTQGEGETVRAHFLDSLVTAILDPRSRLRVIITLRADFTGRPLQYVDFGELIRRRAEFVLPLTPDELEDAIANPTKRAGLSLEPGLSAAIITDLGDQPGALPLLQYTLTELFERRVGNALTLGAYQTSGGVRGALASRADELYSNLDNAGQITARRLFLRLITLGEVTGDGLPAPDTRRRVLRAELTGLTKDGQQATNDGNGAKEHWSRGDKNNVTIQNVINTFGRHRLLTFDRDPVTRGPTVEVAHEALIREWGRLRAWLDEDREFLFWQQRLRAGLHQWQTNDYDEGVLLRGAPLSEAENRLSQRWSDLNEAEREFIQAGLTLRERKEVEREAQLRRELKVAQELAESEKRRAAEQAQATTKLRKRAVWLVGAGLVALLLAIVAAIFGLESRQNAQSAIIAQQAAEYEARRTKAGQLVLQAQAILNSKNIPAGNLPTSNAESHITRLLSDVKEDPSGSLSLLLAREAVLTTLIPDGYFTFEADTVLRQTIEAMPPWRMTLPHPNTVNSAAFSPDGQRIVTTGVDGWVRVWDVAKGEEILTTDHRSLQPFYSATYSPNGEIIAMANDDGSVELRDAATLGQTFHRLEGHTGAVLWVMFSPDGQSLISGGMDGTARLWNVATGREIRQFQGQHIIDKIVFSPDNQTIVVAGAEATVRMFDIATGEEIRRFAGHTDLVNSVAFSPDGKTIATASWDHTARLWNAATGEEVARFEGHTDALRDIAFSPDGKQIATISVDRSVRIWDIALGQEINRLEGHTDNMMSVVFSPDGQTVATASADRTVRLWDMNSREQRRRIENRGEVKSMAVSPDGSTIVIASSLRSGEARVAGLNTGEEIHRLEGHTGEVTAVDMSPDGQTIATAGSDKTVRLWNSETGKEIKQLAGHQDFIFDVAFSPDGESIVTASADKTARVWNTASGEEIARFEGHTDQVRSAAFSPDGQTVVTTGGFRDPTARLWDAATGEEIRVFEGHTDILNSASFSSDGKTIVTASGDGTARLWDVSTGQKIRQFKGHERGVNSAAFSSDGQSIVTAGFDQTVRVWDVTTGKEIRRLQGHTAPVNGAIFSANGQTIISAGDDRTVRVWPGIEALLQEAETLIQRTPPEFTPEERIRFDLPAE